MNISDQISGWDLFHHQQVPSTQDISKDMISDFSKGEKLLSSFVVYADHQTKGRGRSGRDWASLSGNFQGTFSLLLSDLELKDCANYSFLAAVAVSTVLSGILPASCKVEHKWPNDVWVDGKKICGILLERFDRYILIGMGINIGSAPDGAICVNDLLPESMPVKNFLSRLILAIDHYREVFKKSGFPAIVSAWVDRAKGIGQVIRVRTARDDFSGVFVGIHHDGALEVLVDGEMSPRFIYSADVFFS